MIKNLKLLTVKEVATILKLSSGTISQMCTKNKLPAIRVGYEWRIVEEELTKWIKTQRNSRKEFID